MEQGGKRLNRKKRIFAAIIIIFSSVLLVPCGLAANAYRKSNAKTSISIFAGKALEGEPFSHALIEFMPGYDNPAGEVVHRTMTDMNGEAAVELPYGEYTVRWYAGGYYVDYQNVELREETAEMRSWLFPLPEGKEAYILVEWDSAVDVDLCVYSVQNDRCLGRETTLEDAGCFRCGDNDGEKGYEMVYLGDINLNAYAVYIKNNVRCAKDRAKSRDAAAMTCRVYTADGLLYQKTPGREKQARLWNCAYMDNGSVQERDQHIFTLADYAWAARDKENPVSWTEGAGVRAEETYERGAAGRIEEDRFDRDGNNTAHYGYERYGERYIGSEYEYNANGQMIAHYDYWDDGEGYLPVSRGEYEYDQDGRKICHRSYGIENGEESLGYMYEWEYDENGNVTASRFYEGDGTLSSREEYEYNINGNELSCRKYDSEGVIWSERITEYDERGNETAYYQYGENQSLEFKIEYKYDVERHRAIKDIFDENGILDWRREFEYDESGNLRAEYSYNEEGVLTYIDEYDVLGNPTGIYHYEDGVLGWYWEQAFDENGEVLESCEYRDGKLYRRREWVYDENGGFTVYDYDRNGTLETTEYGRDHVYDAVGGMEIFYSYEDGVLTEKKIIVYY